MANYHVRVELHNSARTDYGTLHTAMTNSGFSTIITAGNGQRYYLPPAEYIISSLASIRDVVQAAKNAANTTGRASTVFAVEYTDWWSQNLTPVQ